MMLAKFKKNPFHYLLLFFAIVRMSWLTIKEPVGLVYAAQKSPDASTLPGFAALTLPYVVYPSIFILAAIIVGLMLKKNWANMAAFVFGSIHWVLIVSLVIIRANPGLGPIVVVTANTGMIVFSWLIMKSVKKAKISTTEFIGTNRSNQGVKMK